MNRERLIQVKCAAPYDCQYSLTDDVIDCLQALGMVRILRMVRILGLVRTLGMVRI